jgi:hypothetical protein
MKESDDIREICLMVTDEQHIAFGKFAQMLGTRYPDTVEQCEAGIGSHPQGGIYQFPDQADMFQPLYQLMNPAHE